MIDRFQLQIYKVKDLQNILQPNQNLILNPVTKTMGSRHEQVSETQYRKSQEEFQEGLLRQDPVSAYRQI